MSDINFRDSKYRWHQICIQEFLTSCGPASVAMVERIYKHLQRSDEPRARAISQKYPSMCSFAISIDWRKSRQESLTQVPMKCMG